MVLVLLLEQVLVPLLNLFPFFVLLSLHWSPLGSLICDGRVMPVLGGFFSRVRADFVLASWLRDALIQHLPLAHVGFPNSGP